MVKIDSINWKQIGEDLDLQGYSVTDSVLSPQECSGLTVLYSNDSLFRSRIEMEKYRFGAGEYKYFAYPLPPIIQKLREQIYPYLAPVANRWMEALNMAHSYPDSLDQFLERCKRGGQQRPTPLMLSYKKNGYNCLHQDLYGELFFPIQGTCMLSNPDEDFSGGEFLLVEQRPRAQSVGHVVHIPQGGFVFFATSFRPASGSRGFYRVTMRHGVSRILSGLRFTLGIIFHDAH